MEKGSTYAHIAAIRCRVRGVLSNWLGSDGRCHVRTVAQNLLQCPRPKKNRCSARPFTRSPKRIRKKSVSFTDGRMDCPLSRCATSISTGHGKRSRTHIPELLPSLPRGCCTCKHLSS